MAGGINSYGPPLIDFNPLARLYTSYQQAQQNTLQNDILQLQKQQMQQEMQANAAAPELLKQALAPSSGPGLSAAQAAAPAVAATAAPSAPKVPTFAAIQGSAPSTNIRGVIESASNANGVPLSYMTRTAQIESSFNPNAGARTSSAKGLYQFTDDTAKRFGLTNPYDASANAQAAAELATVNAQGLEAALGRKPREWEVYLAHQQGLGGAKGLLANPNARAADIVGERAVRNNGGDPNMSAAAFAGMWKQKYGATGDQVFALGNQVQQVPTLTADAGPPAVPVAPGIAPQSAGLTTAGGDTALGGTARQAAPAQDNLPLPVPQFDRNAPLPPDLQMDPRKEAILQQLAAGTSKQAPFARQMLQEHSQRVAAWRTAQEQRAAQLEVAQYNAQEAARRSREEAAARAGERREERETKWELREVNGDLLRVNPYTNQSSVVAKRGEFRPMTPEERTAYGVAENTGAFIGPDGKPVSMPGTPAGQKVESAYDVNLGKYLSELYTETQKAGRAATSTRNSLRLMDTLSRQPNFYSGTGEGMVTQAKKALVALGGNGDAASANEIFNSLANDVVLGKLGGSLGAGVSNTDVSFIRATAGDLAKTPEGNRLLIQVTDKMMQRQEDIAKRAREYAKTHGGRIDSGFEAELADWAAANPLFNEAQVTEMQLAARAGGGAPDITAPVPAAGSGAAQAAPARQQRATPRAFKAVDTTADIPAGATVYDSVDKKWLRKNPDGSLSEVADPRRAR